MKKTIIIASLALFLGLAPAKDESEAGQGGGKNVVANPSFEDVENNLPKGWRTANWAGRAAAAAVEFALDETVFRSGKRSIRISSASGADASFQAVVPVEPYAKYRLSGWVKTKDLVPGRSRGALVNLHGLDVQTPAVSGTQDWTRVEIIFDSGANDAVAVNCLFGGWGRATGAAWWDDISLELVSARPLKPQA